VQDSSAPSVIFFAPFGSYQVHHQLDAVIAMALRYRGCQVNVVTCDGILRPCDVLAWSKERAEADCSSCSFQGAQLFGAFQLPLLPLGKFTKRSDFTEARIWADTLDPENYSDAVFEDLLVGNWCTSSVYSYFRIIASGLRDPAVRAVHKGFLEMGVIVGRVFTRMLDQVRPTHAFIFNARFAPYRVAFELARRRGIPTAVHERGLADDTFILMENHGSIESKPLYDCNDQWKSVPMTTAELDGIKRYFENREFGKDINLTPFVDYCTEHATVRQMLRIPADSTLVGVFTSSEYELAYCEDYKTFTSQLDLCRRLIEVFRGRKEYLIIRHHPYIAGNESSPPDLGFLNQAISQAREVPPNVRIIMPSEKLSTYSLFSSLDACFALLSTVGIEAAARGIPTCSFRESPFRDAVFNNVLLGEHEYLETIVNELLGHCERVSAADLSRAYRFGNSIINKMCVRFNSFGIRDVYHPDIRKYMPADLAPGNDPALDRVCDFVIEGTPLVAQPTAIERSRTDSDEREFFDQELARLRQRKAETSRQAHLIAARPRHDDVAVIITEVDQKRGDGWDVKSRHRNFAVLKRQAAGGIEQLIEIVARCKQRFVALGQSNIWFDESFLSSAVDSLGGDQAAQTSKVLYSGWIAGRDGQINRDIFSKRTPLGAYERAVDDCVMLRSWQVLLCFGVYRRDALMQILQTLSSLPEEERALEVIRLFSRDDFKVANQHGLILYE